MSDLNVASINNLSGTGIPENLVPQAITSWVTFTGNDVGTGNVPAIQESFNVATVVDAGTGAWNVFFQTPMQNTNYGMVGAAEDFGTQGDGFVGRQQNGPKTTTFAELVVFNANTIRENSNSVSVMFFGGK